MHGLETLQPGDHWETESVVVTAAMVEDFARLTGDASAIHLSDAAAQAAGFAGRLAHGLLVLALVEGLKARAPVQIATETALAWDLSFRAPVLVGDQLSARVRVEAIRPGRRPMVVLQVEGWTKVQVLRAEARYFGRLGEGA